MQQKNKYIRIQEFLKQNKFPNYRMKQITNAIFPGRINNLRERIVLSTALIILSSAANAEIVLRELVMAVRN